MATQRAARPVVDAPEAKDPTPTVPFDSTPRRSAAVAAAPADDDGDSASASAAADGGSVPASASSSSTKKRGYESDNGDDDDVLDTYGGRGMFESVALKRTKKAVMSTGTEVFPIGKMRAPIANQGTVILSSARADVDLGRTRANMLRLKRGAQPNYPLSAPKSDHYNIQQFELIFTDRRRDRDGTTYSASSTGKLWSAFNGFDDDSMEAVWVGVSDVMLNLGPGDAMALQPEFSVAMAGSRTLLAGPDRIHLGDQVMWCSPYVIDDGKGGVRPGMQVENKPVGKFCAHVGPLSFSEYGSSLNVYRNFMSRYGAGAFSPTNNALWKDLERVVAYLLELARTKPDDSEVHDALSKIVSPHRSAESFRLDLQAIKKRSGSTGKDAQMLLAIGQLLNCAQNLMSFGLERRIGTAMSTGQLGAVDVLLSK